MKISSKYSIQFCLTILLFNSVLSNCQITDSLKKFTYQSGEISSKGLFKNGQPEGFWVNYYKNGGIKSEGNRVNSKLDSIWNFYDEDGVLSVSINYSLGVKQGWKITYNKNLIVVKKELFNSDTLQELNLFYISGNIKEKVLFENGLKHGSSFSYDTTGLEQVWLFYDKGKCREFIINRKDQFNRKTGRWLKFKDGIVREEVNYLAGLKEGYERIYNQKGELLSIYKYNKDSLIKDVRELRKIELKRELNNKGVIIKSGGYTNNGKPHGVHREYDEKGNVKSSNIYNNGILLGSGIVKKNGYKQGYWCFYYPSGGKQSEGDYKNNKKIGKWSYFYENGLLESEGFYSINGKQDSLWREYYSNGYVYEEINYFEGLYHGLYKAFDDSGRVIIQGVFKDNYEDGEWFYINGSFSQKGNYRDGEKVGEWRSYYNKKQLIFKGEFYNGLPVGEHIFWYNSGKLFRLGQYVSGRKTGRWIRYSQSGKVLMITEYSDGLERVLNGYKINPQHESEDYIEYNDTGYK